MQPLPALTYLDLSNQEQEESSEPPEALTTMTSLRVTACCVHPTRQLKLRIFAMLAGHSPGPSAQQVANINVSCLTALMAVCTPDMLQS